jgi:hypothetical protein
MFRGREGDKVECYLLKGFGILATTNVGQDVLQKVDKVRRGWLLPWMEHCRLSDLEKKNGNANREAKICPQHTGVGTIVKISVFQLKHLYRLMAHKY